MALSNPTILNETTNTTGSTDDITTDAAITPAADSFLIAVVFQRRNSTSSSLPAVLTNGGTLDVTWEQQGGDFNLSDLGTNTLTLALFTGVPAATPGSGTVNVDFTGNGFLRGILIYQVTGQADISPDAQVSPVAKGNDLSAIQAVLGVAPAADSLVFAACFAALTASFTPDTGYTELADIPVDGNNSIHTIYRNGGADATVDWASLGGDAALAIAIEIAAAAEPAEPTFSLQLWDGAVWVDAELQLWDGTAWIDV